MAKKHKVSVPKRIAGLKIARPLRRGLKALAQSDAGRVILAEALSAAAAAMAGGAAPAHSRRVSGKATRKASAAPGPEPVVELRASPSHAPLEAAARAFAESLRRQGSPAATH